MIAAASRTQRRGSGGQVQFRGGKGGSQFGVLASCLCLLNCWLVTIVKALASRIPLHRVMANSHWPHCRAAAAAAPALLLSRCPRRKQGAGCRQGRFIPQTRRAASHGAGSSSGTQHAGLTATSGSASRAEGAPQAEAHVCGPQLRHAVCLQQRPSPEVSAARKTAGRQGMADTAAARLARPPLRLTCENSRLHKLQSLAPALVLRPASGVCLCCAALCRGGSRFYNEATRIVQLRWADLPNLVPDCRRRLPLRSRPRRSPACWNLLISMHT